jgi:glycosyltransferase involved in cell wall biosynthesis
MIFFGMAIMLTVLIPTLGRESLRQVLTSILFSNETKVVLLAHGQECFENLIQFSEDPRVELILCDENLSISDLCNIGLDTVTTKYFSYFSDDDEWDPKKINVLLTLLEDKHEIDIAVGSTLQITHSKELPRPTTLLAEDEQIFVYLYGPATLFKNKRYIGLQDAVMRSGQYPRFREGWSVYEDIVWLSDSQQLGKRISAVSDIVSLKYPSLYRSNLRQTAQNSIKMFEVISQVDLTVGESYFRFHAVRAAIGTGDTRNYFEILVARFSEIGVFLSDIFVVPVQLIEVAVFKVLHRLRD